MIIRCLYDKLVPVEDLKSHPQNRNDHPDSQLIELAEILNYQGWRYPIKVSNQSGCITSGHGRLFAAKLNKWNEVPVNYQDYDSPEQEYADVQADNAIALWAQMDLEKIREDLKSLQNINTRMLGIKDFSNIEIPAPFDGEDQEQEPCDYDDKSEEADEIPEKIEPRVKPGDVYKIGAHQLFNGDCLKVLKTLANESIDSLVTDPPAGISFMGKEWDEDKGGSKEWTAWLCSVMKECLRVMKPGAHGLVWAIPRTSHWTATALEDAGFEIRDVVTHIFGSGFPKSLNISKAIDNAAGVEREVIGLSDYSANRKSNVATSRSGDFEAEDQRLLTAPSTPEAKQWDGWGTALKPASEHWILVRKPCSEDTVAKNVLKHGVGGINIDASRVSTNWATDPTRRGWQGKEGNGTNQCNEMGFKNPNTQGRFPANLILSHNPDCVEVGVKKVKSDGHHSYKRKGGSFIDGIPSLEDKGNVHASPDGTETVAAFECTEGCAVAALDKQSGVSKSTFRKISESEDTSIKNQVYGKGYIRQEGGQSDSGGASRFFYCAKPSKREKNEGCEELEEKTTVISGQGAPLPKFTKDGKPNKAMSNRNFHPTVKSTKLMSYLINMVTPPPDGVLLDCFGGSGTTMVSAHLNGFGSTLIEQSPEYCDIILARIEHISEKSAVIYGKA